MLSQLSVRDIAELKEKSLSLLSEFKKQNDIIGTQIFSILGRRARVIYYPFGADCFWGVTPDTDAQDNRTRKPFVIINSSLPSDCQVFAAGHELYHVCQLQQYRSVQHGKCKESDILEEQKANRFAAEFLMEETLLKQELQELKISAANFDVKSLLELATLFCVPSHAMAKRLKEIGLLERELFEELISLSPEDETVYRKRYALPIPQADKRIAIDNLVDLAVVARERRLITYDKFVELLGICGLTPSEFNMQEQTDIVLPSEEDLENI